MSIVGENIKSLRRAVGYTSVFKFATAVGLPEKRVSQWESGNANPKTDDSIKVANFFGIDLQLLREKLLTESEIKTLMNSQKTKNNYKSNVTQNIINEPDVLYLKEKISLLESQLTEKERIIQTKDQVIQLLQKEK